MEGRKEGGRNWGLERLTVEWFQLFRMNTVPEEDLSFSPSTHVRWFMAFSVTPSLGESDDFVCAPWSQHSHAHTLLLKYTYN